MFYDMERDDLVYYREPKTGIRKMAVIVSIIRDEYGQPDCVVIRLMDGTYIETSVRNISY